MLIRYFIKAVVLTTILVVSSALLEASYSLIVLGDFSKEQSESLCRQLSSMGYPVYIVYGENYEVRIGPYETREKAQVVSETLDQDEKINTKIFEEEDLEQYPVSADEDTSEKESAGKVVNEGTKSSYTDERANKIITLALDLFGHPYKPPSPRLCRCSRTLTTSAACSTCTSRAATTRPRCSGGSWPSCPSSPAPSSPRCVTCSPTSGWWRDRRPPWPSDAPSAPIAASCRPRFRDPSRCKFRDPAVAGSPVAAPAGYAIPALAGSLLPAPVGLSTAASWIIGRWRMSCASTRR